MHSLTKNHQSTESLAALCRRAFGQPPVEAAELSEGWFNAIYQITLPDGRQVILKLAPPPGAETLSYERGMLGWEVRAMDLAREQAGIPTAQVLYYDDSCEVCDAPYFFMEKLPGRSFSTARAEMKPEDCLAVERQMGRLVRDMNAIRGARFGYPNLPGLQGDSWPEAFLNIFDSVLEDGRRKQVELPYANRLLHDLAADNLGPLKAVTEPRFVHWDVWDANIMVQDGKITGVLDFERALWGDPLMEQQFRMYDHPSPALEGYGWGPLSREEEVRARLYSLHLNLIMLVENEYRQYDTDQIARFARLGLEETVRWLRAGGK